MSKFLPLLFILALGLASCEIKEEKVQGNLNIVCTTSIIGDMVKSTVGNAAKVKVLMGAGVDPHEYTPTKNDLDVLSNANVIVVHGLELEGKMSEIFRNLNKQGKKIIYVTDGINKSKLLKVNQNDGHNRAQHDPHCWNNPLLWTEAVTYTGEQLADLDTANADTYLNNMNAYITDIKEMHTKYAELFNNFGDEKYLVTAHDAFSYLGDSYGFKVKSLQGASTAAEFGIKDKIELVDFLIEKDIKYVFTESSVPNKNMKSLMEDCASKGHNVTLGGELYSDALGPEGSEAGSYVGMMTYNLETILNAIR
jgi:manganese/zinc/iron transport system substrate-binding protein